jgi:amino acid transporter
LVVGIPILFTNEKFILDFTSIGTLFAFVLVCGGVLVLPRKEKEEGSYITRRSCGYYSQVDSRK